MKTIVSYDLLVGNTIEKVTKYYDCPAIALIDADDFIKEALGDVIVTYPTKYIERITNEQKD